ncbi:hypothetical protein [Streptomyces griseoluteus]|uniref:hypothetical protein n=1 Tax=Streptomyces griseoluteus TaxID=29306 RepID=UPI003700B3AC
MGAPSLTPQELRILAEIEQGVNDEALARRLRAMRVSSRPATWARRARRRALTVAGLVGLVVRACRRWEAAERAGRRTPWPMDPTRV